MKVRTKENRPEGRAGHLTAEERHAIRMAYLETGGTVTRLALAEQFNVNRDTVAACLKGPEFEQLQEQFLADVTARAKRRLQSASLGFADNWITASDAAAKDGDHRPAKDALQAIGAIPRDGASNGYQISINGIMLHGIPMPGMANYTVPELPAPSAAEIVQSCGPSKEGGE
jgi:hypothetical protein